MQQRYYDPQIGRFLSVDPMSVDTDSGDNFNRYRYVNNNPYSHLDSDGRETGPAFRQVNNATAGHAVKPPAGDSDGGPQWPGKIKERATSEAERSGLPGPVDGPQDAYRHCTASCETTRRDSERVSTVLGEVNEVVGDVSNNQTKE